MARLHLFNPDNDRALAAFSPHYTAPRGAARLRTYGAPLSLWYATPGDSIVAYGINERWLEDMSQTFELQHIHLHNHRPDPTLIPSPWGWSPSACTTFINEGMHASQLPSQSTLDAIRALSHRRTAARAMDIIASDTLYSAIVHESFDAPYPIPTEATSLDVLAKALEHLNGNAFIKAPWSGSGRGVFDATKMKWSGISKTADDIIRTQGSIMVESRLTDCTNFAILVDSNRQGAHLRGLSLFTTATNNAYSGNVMASDATIRHMLFNALGRPFDIDSLAESVIGAVNTIFSPHYTGPLGIDMLVGRDAEGRLILHPCVEINVRLTMGFVAHHLTRRLLHPQIVEDRQPARLSIEAIVAPDQYQRPRTVNDNNRLLSGALNLLPPNPFFNIMVTV